MRSKETLIVMSLLFLAVSAAAITIDFGPTYIPPGMGTETLSGDADTLGGLTLTYAGMDLSQTANLYFGIRNDLYENGFSMDGSDISGMEIFRFESAEANVITYVGSTTLEVLLPGPITHPTATRMTLTFDGPGTMVEDATTDALSGAKGDVGALWTALGDFSVNVLIEAQVPPGDPNAGNWEPARDLFNRLETIGVSSQSAYSVDWAFYYQVVREPGDANGDGVVDGADYTIWADNFGVTDAVGPSEGDFNRDGLVDGADYTIWADNFGAGMESSGAGGSGAAEVPACGLGLELLVVVPVLLRLRRRWCIDRGL